MLQQRAERRILGVAPIAGRRAAVDLVRVRRALQVLVQARKLRELFVTQGTLVSASVERVLGRPALDRCRLRVRPVGVLDELPAIRDDVLSVGLDGVFVDEVAVCP